MRAAGIACECHSLSTVISMPMTQWNFSPFDFKCRLRQLACCPFVNPFSASCADGGSFRADTDEQRSLTGLFTSTGHGLIVFLPTCIPGVITLRRAYDQCSGVTCSLDNCLRLCSGAAFCGQDLCSAKDALKAARVVCFSAPYPCDLFGL